MTNPSPRASGAPRRQVVLLAGLTLLLALVFLLALALGSASVPIEEVVAVLTGSAGRDAAVIVSTIRLPRALTAVLAGAALGVAGLQMQTLFRNPLADPFTLGISSGASLGVALVTLGPAGFAALFGSPGNVGGDLVVMAAATAGAALALGLVLLASARLSSPTVVLILGLMVGYAVSAVVMVLVGATQPERLQQWAQWGFGSFEGVTWPRLRLFAPLIGGAIVLAAATTKQLNVLLLGDDYAQSMGLAVRRARLLTMATASVLGGVVTAFCGPIAFLGVAVPHVCRGLLRTSDHRVLIPATVLAGGTLALAAQVIALLPAEGGVLPINAVTSLLGAPVVMIVLLRHGRGAPR